MTPPVTLAGQGLDLAAVVRVARHGARVELAPEARARVARAREVVERLAREDRPIYGTTTGTGARKDTRVAAEDLAAFQRRLLLSHSVAVGPPFAADAVRAILLARANTLATGGAGVQPRILDTLVAMLNAGVHPVIPSRGSIGAADLGPLSHLALPLIGLGEADYRGERLPGGEALRRAGLEPVALGPKDGLALCNANAATVGHAALVLWDANDRLEAATAAAALAFEGFAGNVEPLDPRVHAARPAPGQVDAAARLSALLAGSRLWEPGTGRRVQDPVSFRCVPHVHGAAAAAIGSARQAVEVELNAAGDNPLVVPDDDVILSTGNFHVGALALAFDLVALALGQVTRLSLERSLRLMSAPQSGLPAFLTPRAGTRTGFATLQKTLAALAAEVRHLANPASLDVVAVADGQEDHATMAPLTVRKADEILSRLATVVAIELMAAAQAVDLRGAAPALGRGTRAAFEAVRKVVPPLDDDRVLGPEVERLAGIVASGSLLAAIQAATPSGRP